MDERLEELRSDTYGKSFYVKDREALMFVERNDVDEILEWFKLYSPLLYGVSLAAAGRDESRKDLARTLVIQYLNRR